MRKQPAIRVQSMTMPEDLASAQKKASQQAEARTVVKAEVELPPWPPAPPRPPETVFEVNTAILAELQHIRTLVEQSERRHHFSWVRTAALFLIVLLVLAFI